MEVTFDPNARFEKALVSLIRSFNYLDTNIGLCISHLSHPSNPSGAYPALAKMTPEKRVERLKMLLETKETAVKKKVLEELAIWYKKAANVRNIRNRYVHGNWEYLPLRHREPVGVSAPPWMKEKLGSLANETMSLEQLELVASEVETVFQEFMQLRRKYGV